MNESPVQPVPKRRRWPYILALAIFLFVALFVAYRYWLQRRVEARIEAIRQQGYPVSGAELVAWQKRPPVDPRIVGLAPQAFTSADPWTSEQRRQLPVVGLAPFPSCSQPLSAELTKTIADYLAADAERMKSLHELSELQPSRYPADWFVPPFNFPYMNGIRQGQRMLQLETMCQIESHDSERAAHSVLAGLRLAKPLGNEPFVLPHLLRIACEAICVSSLNYVLCRSPLTDAQIAMLASAIAEAESEQLSAEAWIGDRCLGMDQYRKLLHDDSWEKMGMWSGFGSDEIDGVVATMDRYLGPSRSAQVRIWQFKFYKFLGIREWDFLRYLDGMEDGITTSRLSYSLRYQKAKEWNARAQRVPRRFAFTRGMGSWSGAVFLKEARRIALLRAVRTALAVEQYRNATGRLPENLKELVPSHLASIPVDPFDGKLIRYRKLATGYVVYSVGEDEADDGGKEKNAQGRMHETGSDIVFAVER